MKFLPRSCKTICFIKAIFPFFIIAIIIIIIIIIVIIIILLLFNKPYYLTYTFFQKLSKFLRITRV